MNFESYPDFRTRTIRMHLKSVLARVLLFNHDDDDDDDDDVQ